MNGKQVLATSQRLLTAAGCCAAMMAAGCGSPTLGPQAYERAKLVENLTDYRRPEQIALARGLIEEDYSAHKITADEREALLVPLNLAENDRWDAAAEQARDLLIAQQKR
ncbi:hypothetical protein [Alienimonas chondri]|uniref:DUF4398 domain-containing protein n=1 Tax=Alienimonas chondri TaxID=2681879 RepID=A0ABX1VH48_9PLAN|nr:hypothetical protein [Alienimonas chondri]NNJ26781.1 hypothetical protein [Alienimonas chondri]